MHSPCPSLRLRCFQHSSSIPPGAAEVLPSIPSNHDHGSYLSPHLKLSDSLMDPESQAVSSSPPPVIDLPHRWGENGKLLPGTSPAQCPICGWNGDPDSFWRYDRRRGMGELTGRDFMQEPITCAACKLLRCILSKRAEVEGTQVTESSCIIGPDFHVVTWFDREVYCGNHSIFVSSGTPRSDIDRYNISRRYILNGDSLNDRSAEWVQERLAACANSHELCKSQSGDYFLPTRLINLKPGWKGLDVRLEKSSPVRPSPAYVALSYCWGDYRPACITTAGTLAENQARISWDKLPATFQDAASFTQSLGIQFLWIDSICIIQEDEDDWQREAGKMNAVYKNSYLTLAALSGSDSNSGLHNISIKQDSHVVAELRIAQNVYPLYMRQAHYLDSLFKSKIMAYHEYRGHRYPLLGRAWAYQERTISPRVVFFTESEMIFQCLEHVECECGAAQEWNQTQTVHRTNKTSIFMQTESESLKLKGKDRASERFRCDLQTQDGRDWEIARDWRSSVVREYSALELSMSRDRLPALGAVAEQFKRARVGEAYLAGLWSRSLLDDLLWFCVYAQPPASPQESTAKLERPFSLPTWSWASLNISVGYGSPDFSVPRAEIIEAKCSYLGENEFGILESSRLVLRGRVLASVVRNGPDDCSFYVCDGDKWARFVDNSRSNLSIRMDWDHDWAAVDPMGRELYILEISESTYYEDDSHIDDWNFLLLHREDQGGLVSYTRAGMATFLRQNSEVQLPEFEEPQDGFERVFEVRSVLTTCLIL